MKVGDLVIMPGETLNAGDDASVGLIVEGIDPQRSGFRKRVGVIWAGSNVVDFEPKEWLEVINESR